MDCTTVPTETKRSRCSLKTTSAVALLIVTSALSGLTGAQQALQDGTVVPMSSWVEAMKVQFVKNERILLHLRTAYERAIVMPEAVTPKDPEQRLTGCEIIIDGNVIAFYPTESYTREIVTFVGLETGTEYEFGVRSSTSGFRQPMQIIGN